MGVYYGQYKEKVDSLAWYTWNRGLVRSDTGKRSCSKGSTNFAGELELPAGEPGGGTAGREQPVQGDLNIP